MFAQHLGSDHQLFCWLKSQQARQIIANENGIHKPRWNYLATPCVCNFLQFTLFALLKCIQRHGQSVVFQQFPRLLPFLSPWFSFVATFFLNGITALVFCPLISWLFCWEELVRQLVTGNWPSLAMLALHCHYYTGLRGLFIFINLLLFEGVFCCCCCVSTVAPLCCYAVNFLKNKTPLYKGEVCTEWHSGFLQGITGQRWLVNIKCSIRIVPICSNKIVLYMLAGICWKNFLQ